METGRWLLKPLTQRGHSFCSFWGAVFIPFPLCGHVPLLSSLMMDFPPFPHCGAMEHGSLQVTLTFSFSAEEFLLLHPDQLL